MLLRYLWKTFRVVTFIILCILGVKTFIGEAGKVNGVSMVPTYQDNETFFVQKYTLLFTAPVRQQVVQCKNPLTGTLLIKRIIGIPGDTVHIRNNTISITAQNGTEYALVEPYLAPNSLTQMWNNESGDIILERDEYFVLGDNRRESIDSRHYGTILRKDILGAVSSAVR